MMASIDYLEKHLEDRLDIEQAAKEAYMSKFHYQRMFHMLTGITVAEYVRKRKLTLAAQELIVSKTKIIDLALKYGYETPESFSKAFRKLHGVSPSEARNHNTPLKAIPRLSFQIQIKGEEDMNYRIVEKDAFEVIGKTMRVSTVNGENFKRIPEFWQTCNSDGASEGLMQDASDLGMLGICMEFEMEQESFTYMIAVEKNNGLHSDNFVVKKIPSATWAVFEVIGPMPHAIQAVWKRIYGEWFPSTNYEHANAPEIEVYPSGDPTSENYKTEIWIPVVKK
ncbi:AraC family transcriptional regulator [Bacillus sp. HMF5848]|nr:AraC family transcriptional regulator [Bacillus sp. HMF5848]RSK29299.1 AraC family transcriptional regulator [Bacillus sp. HMF5848]